MTTTDDVAHIAGPVASKPRRWIAPAVLVLAVGVLAVAGRFLPVGEGFLAAMDGMAGLGVAGAVAFGAIYVVATVLLMPGSVLTAGAGLLFGLAGGTILVSAASTIGATLAFLLGRGVARGQVERSVARSARFAAIDRAVGREGFKIVLLTRLTPIFPFNLLNYAYGLTRVSPVAYVSASWLGMLPGTVMYVYLGTLAGSLAGAAAGRSERSAVEWAFLLVGGVVAVGVTVFLARLARRALREEVAQPARPDGARTGTPEGLR